MYIYLNGLKIEEILSHTSGCCDNLSLIISDFYALIEMLNWPDDGFMITVRLKSSEGR